MTFKRPLRLITVPAALALLALGAGSPAAGTAGGGDPHGAVTVVAPGDISFVEIAPFARFGSAQGDFTAGAHGTFGVFGAGQAAPVHTHSGAYYGVVLDGGEMNNPFGIETDPPTLAPGSFWSVPADEEHVTACLDPAQDCRFFFHAAEAFDFVPIGSATQPRSNVAQSIPVSELTFDEVGPFDEAALAWGHPDSGPFGLIVRLEAGDRNERVKLDPAVTLVPLTGDLTMKRKNITHALAVGSLAEAEANSSFKLTCESGDDCLVYVFAD